MVEVSGMRVWVWNVDTSGARAQVVGGSSTKGSGVEGRASGGARSSVGGVEVVGLGVGGRASEVSTASG